MGSKFTRLHVYIIGFVVFLVVGLGMGFMMIHPANEEATLLAAGNEKLSQDVAAVRNAPEQYQKNTTEAQARKNQLQALVARYQLPPRAQVNLGNATDLERRQALDRWWALPTNVVNMARAHAQSDPRVLALVEFEVPDLVTKPSEIPDELVEWKLGTVTATGNFRDVMNWVRRWNRFKLLTSVDNLALETVAPPLVTAECEITVYMRINKNRPETAIPDAVVTPAPPEPSNTD